MIRVAFLHDHPAVRAGIQAILATEPDLRLVGFADDEHALWRLLERTRPAIVILDLHHPGRDGLALCLQIKRQADPPAVLLYCAHAPAPLVVAAAVAAPTPSSANPAPPPPCSKRSGRWRATHARSRESRRR